MLAETLKLSSDRFEAFEDRMLFFDLPIKAHPRSDINLPT